MHLAECPPLHRELRGDPETTTRPLRGFPSRIFNIFSASRNEQACYALIVPQGVQKVLVSFFIAIAAGAVVAGLNKLFTTSSLKKSLLIAAVVSLVVLLASVFVSWDHTPGTHLIVEGTVVDEWSNDGIGQALISISGGGKSCTSVDNGNFVMDLTGQVKESQTVRIRVTKDGYKPYDLAVAVPAHEVVVPLHHL